MRIEKPSCMVMEAYMLRFGLTYRTPRKELPNHFLAQLSHCNSDEARRLLLGISS